MRLDSDLAAAAVHLARSEGFVLAGFTDLHIEPADRMNLEQFVREERYGEMEWFPRYQVLRLDPGHLLHDSREEKSLDELREERIARSALVLGMIYVDREYEATLAQAAFRISRYAAGRDYHRILKKRARPIVSLLRERMPGIEARICVDSVPLPEKILARKAGLGWQGKHTNLIHPEFGSWFFLCVILLSAEISPELQNQGSPPLDLCRDCTLCLKACPTGALQAYRIDPRRCLSYITIESREDRRQQAGRRRGWVFGCDICQEVCPYNRSPRATKSRRIESAFAPLPVMNRLLETPPDPELWKQTEGSALRRIQLEELAVNYEMASRSGDE